MRLDLRASDVVALLRRKRVRGYCFTEVGVDHGRLRLDLVEVLNIGHGEIDGYEIKVERQDYRNDDKWPGYLPHCHRFWFVAPPSVITIDDLADIDPDVGLIHVNERTHKRGDRTVVTRSLRTVRSARRRAMDPEAEAAVLYSLVGGRGGKPGKVY